MIIDRPRMTREEYQKFLSNYYEKPGIPEIELKLKAHQERILLDGDYSHLSEFKADVQVYVRSLILKRIKNTDSDYIDEYVVESLASEAADNFVKRYFRSENPAIGASFAGVLDYKAQEVLSKYWKSSSIESSLSLDDVLQRSDDSRQSTFEGRLSYLQFIKQQEESEEDYEEEVEKLMSKIDKECEILDQIYTKYDMTELFLTYLIYLILLQYHRRDKKLTTISSIALSLLEEEDIKELTPILESALLDTMES